MACMPSTITSTDGWVYVEYNDLYYTTGNLQSNQLYIAAFKWFKWFKVHVAYSSRTNMATENINGAPQQLYCQFHRL